MTKKILQCNDDNPKKYNVTFDAGNAISSGNDTILLCSKCYNQPPFDRFVLKVERFEG